jgi:hypothetical protein
LLSYCQHCLIAGVADTGEPFAAVVTPPKNCSPVSTTQLSKFSPVSLTVLTISACLGLKMKSKQNSIYKCKADSNKLLTKYEKFFFSFIACVVDPADKHSFTKISMNLQKNLKWS